MSFWKNLLVSPDKTIIEAIEILHKGGARIVLVVDKKMKLLGTVTDGDIRRALINKITMDCTIDKIMNNSPITALISDSTDSIMSTMKNKELLHIPLLNKDGALAGLETLSHILNNKKYDNPVFIMAGGFGKRLRPLTEKIPKPLLKVGSRPILETIISQFVDAGFHNFYISTHYKADMISEHFGDGSRWNATIKYLNEDKPLGTAGSLGLLPDNISNLPVILMNGDLLTKVNFEHLLDFHCKQGSLATMCVREYDFQVPYGVIETNNHDVSSILEKPVHKFFVNAGIYVLEQALINRIDGRVYIDIPDLFNTQIKKGEKISAFPIHEYWLDIGMVSEYEKANKEILDIL